MVRPHLILLPEAAFLQHAVFSQLVQPVVCEVRSKQQPATSQILLLQFCQVDSCLAQQFLTKSSTNITINMILKYFIPASF
jgi:hypothetical protein